MALIAWGMGPEVCASMRVAAAPFIASQAIIAPKAVEHGIPVSDSRFRRPVLAASIAVPGIILSMNEQRTRPVVYAVWLIVASVIGLFAAFQLTIDKILLLENPDATLSCNVSVMIQCGKNLGSWQGELFGFPNPLLGVAGWMAPLVVGVALLAGARFPRWFWAAFGAGVALAFLFVCWLIGQSIYAPNLGVLCPWCMLTWSVTIPTFLATALHLTRNGTLTRSPAVRARADRLMVWVPLATILAYAIVILLAQLRGLDLLGEVFGSLF